MPTPAVFAYELWEPRLSQMAERYAAADPFPYALFDDFLVPVTLEAALGEFPRPDSADWIQYRHLNSKKLGLTDRKTFPPTIGAVIDELNSPRFVRWLQGLTGIGGLFADPSLAGGGMHQSVRGGYLNIHADFTVHPYQRDWKRRVNMLVYLNRDWRDEYGGHIELWDRQMTRCVQRVAPLFNRCVIFNTDADSFHGHPDPLRCPEGMTRKSLALYYFTRAAGPIKVQSTEYRPRPTDRGLKGALITFDKWVLRVYDYLRRKLGISDATVGKVLGFLGRGRGRRKP